MAVSRNRGRPSASDRSMAYRIMAPPIPRPCASGSTASWSRSQCGSSGSIDQVQAQKRS